MPEPDPTHGLSVQHADALWDAVAIPGPRQATFTEQHERVCRAVAQIIGEVTPVADPEPAAQSPADRAALRERIADVLLTTRRTDYADLGVQADHRRHRFDARCALCTYDVDALADAVLAVLPEPGDQAAVERAFAERLADELKGCCAECDACIEIAQHLAGHNQPATQADEGLTERLERGRAQLLEAMSAVSEDRTCTGWAGDWARTLHAEGGIWETLGRAVGWPTGNYDQWVWVTWDEAAALYASKETA